ncbi:helix-turn-helix transcriptional regulator [Massilia sp. Dwa41.01b]|uniref:helix-turn-helix domain-containing protein n=1 Tax=unclassified Massilia TaxID=2609279 RepID=UPI0016003A5C|nr:MULTISPECIES: helix-turn-helix transcriptional regulator [unclassified Massilia]QNA88713.1 helix-turn-helix transcriptional regulator [Massilia sp. Dwa41.01b]QNA99612.1 helix-turn-helix transcriptional regulator [Massilia sp. Se16.2.3]
MSVFAKRMKEARLRAGLSQEKLGVLAGIDEMSSSARMNQYERGKHEPDFSLVERVAKVLDVPECYFYCKDDDVALVLVQMHQVPAGQKQEMIGAVRRVLADWSA